MKETIINRTKICVKQGDITEECVDAIVNAANTYLKHGGGVAKAIVDKGGYIIQKESDAIGYVRTGEAAITTGGKLAAKFVIHAVGPRWGEGDEHRKLKSAVKSSLELAESRLLKSISFPAISAGIFGFPKEECADVMLNTLKEHFEDNVSTSLREVNIVLFGEDIYKIFEAKFDEVFSE